MQAAIERTPVCVGSSVRSAGDLAGVLYYRAVAIDARHIEVGYFAFFSEERPWGNNWLTWSVLPALAVDLVYSRTLLIAPGLQRFMYGPGDVEGVRVTYEIEIDDTLRFERAVADDGTHAPRPISREEAFAIDGARPTFYTDVWSHQLGGAGARMRSDLAYDRCFEDGTIRPLPDAVADRFHLDVRATPAHVEWSAAQRLDVSSPVVVSARAVHQEATAR
jgi:hypothetical protein